MKNKTGMKSQMDANKKSSKSFNLVNQGSDN
jgi:hypothetical protein